MLAADAFSSDSEGDDAGWVRFEYNGNSDAGEDDDDGFYNVDDDYAVGQVTNTFSAFNLPSEEDLGGNSGHASNRESLPVSKAGHASNQESLPVTAPIAPKATSWFNKRMTSAFRLDRVPVSAPASKS